MQMDWDTMERLNDYQREQLQALTLVRKQMMAMDTAGIERMSSDVEPYLDFRHRLDLFTRTHLGEHCTQACFESQTSACCSRDGIITFWADVVINAICSGNERLDDMASAIQNPQRAEKCIYLANEGCLWKIRPLVCAMFLCDPIQADIIDPDAELVSQWQGFLDEAKTFRWPDRPVLFDQLELQFMELGCRSPLMYINTSPGLLRVKQLSTAKQDGTIRS